MLIGEGGILKQAGEARERTGRANIIEQARVDLLEKQTENKGKVSKEDLYEVLNKYFENVPDLEDETWNDEETWKKEELTGKNDKTVKVEIGEIYGGTLGEKGSLTLVEMYENAEKAGCTNEDGTCTNPEHLHIGDYVNYPNPTSGSYTVEEDKLGAIEDEDYPFDNKVQTYEITIAKNQLNWRVLGKDSETGGIKLIAGSPMKSNNTVEGQEYPYLFMYGAKAYINSVEQLNNICKLYSTDLGKARSVTQKDINEITGITTEEKIKEVNLKVYYGGKNYKERYGFYEYTPESWLNGKKETTVEGEVTGYFYQVALESGVASKPVVALDNKRAYNTLFDDVKYGDRGNFGRSYWLATISVYADSQEAYFGPGSVRPSYDVPDYTVTGTDMSFGSLGGEETGDAYAVRPVVSLKSNITLNEIPKLTDKVEEEWNYMEPRP